MRYTLFFAILALLATSAGANTWREVNADFFRALESRDLSALRATMTGSLYEEDRRQVRQVLSAFAFITRCNPEPVAVRDGQSEVVATVRIEGEGQVPGGSPDRLPRSWTLTFVRHGETWLVQKVVLAESELALDIARSPEDWHPVDISPEVSPAVLIRLLLIHVGREPDSAKAASILAHCDELARNGADRASIDLARGERARRSGKLKEAQDWSCRAGVEAREIGEVALLKLALFKEAAAEILQGENESAFARLRTAENLPGPRDEVLVGILLTEGTLATATGHRREAIELFERAKETSRDASYQEGIGIANMNIGSLYIELGYDEIAERYLQRASSQLLPIGRYNASVVSMHLARIAQRAGHFTAALKSAQQALSLLNPDQSFNRIAALRTTASIFRSQKKHDEADRVILEAIDLARTANPENLGIALSDGAEISLRRSRFDDAFARASEALHDTRTVNEDALLSANTALASVYIHRGQRDQAREVLSAAISESEARRSRFPGDLSNRASYFRDLTLPYERMIQLLVDEGKTREALQWSERKRARALLDGLAIPVPSTPRAEPDASESQRETALQRELNQLLQRFVASDAHERPNIEARLASARTDFEELRASHYMRHPEMVPLSASGDFNIDAQPVIAAGSAIVEYAVIENRVLVFVVTRDIEGNVEVGSRWLRPDYESLSNAISRFGESVEQRDFGYRERARRLYDDVVAPIEALIAPFRSVCLIPDGALWRLPFAALLNERGAFWSGVHSIYLAPSIAVLRNTKQESIPKEPPRFVGFGDPRLSAFRVGFAPLPDANTEVRAISRQYASSRVLTGAAASLDSALREMGHGAVLHFATHAIVDDRHPMYSGLLLAGPEGREARILDGHDIAAMPLEASIAVLSACETGRGRISNGEGLIGLSWAFRMAGCPTTVVSQWRVDSKATAVFMVEFHRLLAGGASPARALRGAQQMLRRDPRFEDPLYWAAFVVIGRGNDPLLPVGESKGRAVPKRLESAESRKH